MLIPRQRRAFRRHALLGALTLVVLGFLLDVVGLGVTLLARLPMGQHAWLGHTHAEPVWQRQLTVTQRTDTFTPVTAAVPNLRQALPRVFDDVALQEVCAPVLWASPSHAARGQANESSWWKHRWVSAGADASWPDPSSLHCPVLPVPEPGSALDRAHARLRQVVRKTGLAGVHVPPWVYTDRWRMLALADKLDASNRTLQGVTGWPGPVLGLGGRVVLNVRPNNQPDRLADAWMDSEGFIHLTGEVQSLAHEWFHGLDFLLAASQPHPFPWLPWSSQLTRWDVDEHDAMAQLWQALSHPVLTPVEQAAIHTQAVHGAITWRLRMAAEMTPSDLEAWKRHHARMLAQEPRSGSPWLMWRRAEHLALRWGLPMNALGHVGTQTPAWWRQLLPVRNWDPAEMLADAFAYQAPPSAGLNRPENEGLWYAPFPTERAHQRAAFTRFFAATQPFWLTQFVPASEPEIEAVALPMEQMPGLGLRCFARMDCTGP